MRERYGEGGRGNIYFEKYKRESVTLCVWRQ